jgi:hypothetical protein
MSAMPNAERKHELRRRFEADCLRPTLRFALDAVMSVEVTAQRAVDLVRSPAPPIPTGSTTAVIKTFQRPRQAHRLVKSIKRVQPELPTLVVDDNLVPASIPGAELLEMPFDGGILVRRNAAL